MKKDIALRQQQLKEYVREYGLNAAAEGTGLPVCDIRRTYTDADPIYDHVVRVFLFYKGLEYDQRMQEPAYYE